MKGTAEIGVIGLGVMGGNLALNLNDHGFKVAVFNRTLSKAERFLKEQGHGSHIVVTSCLKHLIQVLKRPRSVLLMIQAGRGVDALIEELLGFVEKGDIIIDGGNSHFSDTERRHTTLKEKGILFVGAGISGGEEGARRGPSIMPGGNQDAWPLIRPVFQKIAARSEEGACCCNWVGEGGAGHYVKMVHNGIEYADMQIICEAYHLLSSHLGLKEEALSKQFEIWNRGKLKSYLIEITSHILRFKEENGTFLLSHILDVAKQKGTGAWTVKSALELGVPATLIADAVFARHVSVSKNQRMEMSKHFKGPPKKAPKDQAIMIEHIEQAVYASKIISYTQGFMLMREAAKQYTWTLNYGEIASMWQGGCIIRSAFLEKITKAFEECPTLESLLLDPFFKQAILDAETGWRSVVAMGATCGIPLPCISGALTFFDGQRASHLPANLIQAQRDFFGAHTYERIDQPRHTFFHTNWSA